jgi:hypothetical protein
VRHAHLIGIDEFGTQISVYDLSDLLYVRRIQLRVRSERKGLDTGSAGVGVDRLEQVAVKGHKDIDDIDLSTDRTSVVERDLNPQRIVLDRKQFGRYDESH